MSSERAAVLDAIRECAAPGMELRHDGSEDPVAAAYVAGVQTAYEAAKGALESCVVPDPRITRIEALAAEAEHNATRWHDPLPVPAWVEQVRAILRGDQ